MSASFSARVQTLLLPIWLQHIQGIKRGFEKECLRVNQRGILADTPHPKNLGSSLTHPLITTDYSEALLEFITPPTDKLHAPLEILDEIHRYTVHSLPNEVLWSASMPCILPKEEDIPIAQYGDSNIGQLKHIYRRGLGYRYGRAMQTIAGIHYNFSLGDSFWEAYHILLESPLSLTDFRSEQYLGLIRNGLRMGWILPYLFGATPAVCASFFKHPVSDLARWKTDTYIGKYATSLRLSDLGYSNNVQSRVQISYNSLDEFIATIKKAVHTPVPEYQKIGVFREGEYRQLSDCIFQIEDEHYAMFRPKRVSNRDERTLAAIIREGIEYIEMRALDIHPHLPLGVDQQTVYFLDVFLLTCLLLESPPLTDAENQKIGYNHSQIVKSGRQPDLVLQGEMGEPVSVRHWGLSIIEKMRPVAEILDKTYKVTEFTGACESASEKLLNADLLPSARVLQEMLEEHESYFDFAWHWSLGHQKQFQRQAILPSQWDYYRQLAEDSIQAQVVLENSNEMPFKDYLSKFLEI